MKRWHWASLALLGGIVAVALIAVPRIPGGGQRAAAQPAPPSLELDMDVTNGDGPCDPIDTTRAEDIGGASYKIAVCLKNAPSAPDTFNFSLVYDDSKNTCVTSGNTNLDSNPDANLGSTTFSSPDLGGVWDCTGAGFAFPSCDRDTASGAGHGQAYLGCIRTSGSPTLPVGQGVAAPLAEVTFLASGGGDDNLTLTDVAAADVVGTTIVICTTPPDEVNDVGTCVGGTDSKGGPTSTPQPTATNTTVPTSAATPRCALVAGIEGLPTCEPTSRAHTPTPTTGPTETATPGPPPSEPSSPPPASGGPGANVIPPNTGQGTSGLPWGGSVLWAISAIAVASVAGGGLYLRRVRTRR
jgi:hypothetical protein